MRTHKAQQASTNLSRISLRKRPTVVVKPLPKNLSKEKPISRTGRSAAKVPASQVKRLNSLKSSNSLKRGTPTQTNGTKLTLNTRASKGKSTFQTCYVSIEHLDLGKLKKGELYIFSRIWIFRLIIWTLICYILFLIA